MTHHPTNTPHEPDESPATQVTGGRLAQLQERLGPDAATVPHDMSKHTLMLEMLRRLIERGDWDEAPAVEMDEEGNPIEPGEDDEIEMAACVQFDCTDLEAQYGEQQCNDAIDALGMALASLFEGGTQTSIMEVMPPKGSNQGKILGDIVFPGWGDDGQLKNLIAQHRHQLEAAIRTQCHGAQHGSAMVM